MMGVFAEFERSMIQERVKAGLRREERHNRPELESFRGEIHAFCRDRVDLASLKTQAVRFGWAGRG